MTHVLRPSERGGVGLAAGIAALALAGAMSGPVAAAPQWLTNGTVSPTAGTTSTQFAFSVDYVGPSNKAPTVTASVGAGSVVAVVAMSPSGGGKFRGTAFLPAGTWSVTFDAAVNNTHSTLAGPSLTVSPVVAGPQPTLPPAATPPATPAPSPPGTGLPTTPPIAPTPIGAANQTATATAAGTPAATSTGEGFVGGVIATATPSVGRQTGTGLPAEDLGDEAVWTLLAGGLVGITVLALIGVAGLLRRRPHERADARIALLPPEARMAAPAPEAARSRPRAEWEASELDDRPIGTVEYEPPSGSRP